MDELSQEFACLVSNSLTCWTSLWTVSLTMFKSFWENWCNMSAIPMYIYCMIKNIVITTNVSGWLTCVSSEALWASEYVGIPNIYGDSLDLCCHNLFNFDKGGWLMLLKLFPIHIYQT